MDLRKLPKVDALVAAPQLAALKATLGPRALVATAREVVAEWRGRVKAGEGAPEPRVVVEEVRLRAERRLRRGSERVVNATGVLLHTNLGRAPLMRASAVRLAALAGGYQNLELDIESGARSRRGSSAEAALAELVGAEDALIANNNAAAVMLALSHIAAGREVIVSRGELVEIGGGFRVPEVLARSGASLVEVGTTNRTRVEDYARAISERTACLLRVHPSNFKISGFTERPDVGALAALARQHGIPLVKDLGGGLVVDPAKLGIAADFSAEPTVQACLAAGADLVCFSLDKLFGGPQGGVVVGRAELVRALRADPLARAIRVDKLTLTALEPVVAAYTLGRPLDVPVLAMLATPLSSLEQRIARWRGRLGDLATRTEVVPSECAVGGGTLADVPIESRALRVSVDAPNVEEFARALRNRSPAVLGRISDGAFLLDARSVLEEDEDELIRALAEVLAALEKS